MFGCFSLDHPSVFSFVGHLLFSFFTWFKRVVIICFSLDHHRLGARTDCGFGLRPLPALAFWGFGFLFVLLLTSLPLDDRDFWLAFGWLWFFPFGSAGLRLMIRLWFSDTRGA